MKISPKTIILWECNPKTQAFSEKGLYFNLYIANSLQDDDFRAYFHLILTEANAAGSGFQLV